jgi:hypothetical protein
MRLSRAAVMAAALLGALAVASPAAADPTDNTPTTFNVVGAGLDITAPLAASLGSGIAGSTITGSLGTVTVVDDRGGADGTWNASVTATNFETGGHTPTERVLATQITYWSGPGSGAVGNGTFVPGQSTAAAAQALDNVTGLVAFSHIGGTGNNTVAWAPTLNVNVPGTDQTGLYSGSVTHSVA